VRRKSDYLGSLFESNRESVSGPEDGLTFQDELSKSNTSEIPDSASQ